MHSDTLKRLQALDEKISLIYRNNDPDDPGPSAYEVLMLMHELTIILLKEAARPKPSEAESFLDALRKKQETT